MNDAPPPAKASLTKLSGVFLNTSYAPRHEEWTQPWGACKTHTAATCLPRERR